MWPETIGHINPYHPANLSTFVDLCQNADENLFAAVTGDFYHVLHHLIPPQSQGSQHYNLRSHSFALPSRTGHLTDKNFMQRMLYMNSY